MFLEKAGFWKEGFLSVNHIPMAKNKPGKEKTEPNFFEDVYEVVKLIPKGSVTSYGAIARYLGTGMSARMVGWAMNASHGQDVPAHRVINSVGVLSGKHFFANPTQMQQLLEAEGIGVESDRVVDFKALLWDPSHELAV